ncbi:MAG: ABC transporter ATP-binding protein, partial [Chloroflexota bacterium]|nr:ABC transporter ATP-binding protein [Chloroflexota bacterium]
MPPTAVSMVGIGKRYAPGAPPALEHLTLEVAEGELLFLLGPSGSGKTTTLRLIAGYERPDAGTILFGGVPVQDVPAHRRNVGMVFQSYALFPHMTVAQNVAFGLRMRGASRQERARAVAWALDLVKLPGLEGRFPRELSGGQQQRVALARALAFRPALLLLDEPLANLDRYLRAEMRLELKALQRRLGVTTVFVTHDQEEALALADRVAVLDGGRLQQVGAPASLYTRPQNGFVARFLGEMNLLPGTLLPGAPGPGSESGAPAGAAAVAGTSVPIHPPEGARPGAALAVCLRAERLRLHPLSPCGDGPGASPPDSWSGTVRLVTYLGAGTHYLVDLDALPTGPPLRVCEAGSDDAP